MDSADVSEQFQALKGTEQTHTFSQAPRNHLNLKVDNKHFGENHMRMCSGINSAFRARAFCRYRNGWLQEQEPSTGRLRVEAGHRFEDLIIILPRPGLI